MKLYHFAMSNSQDAGSEEFSGWLRDRLRITPAVAPGRVAPDTAHSDRAEQLSLLPEPSTGLHPGPAVVKVGELGDASKWAAGGFSAVTALLLFFGIKEGVLDQALRLNPLAALCVFLLLGLGVLAALFARAFEETARIYLWAVFAGIAAMVGIAAIYFPNIDLLGANNGLFDTLSNAARASLLIAAMVLIVACIGAITLLIGSPSDWRWRGPLALLAALGLLAAIWIVFELSDVRTWLSVLLFIAFLGGIAWTFVKRVTLPTTAGVIILGVAATSLGLYGASKLSVESKMLGAQPQVSAIVAKQDGRDSLKLIAVASHMRNEMLQVTVFGQSRVDPRDTSTPFEMIWREILEPNSLDDVHSTVDVPIVLTRWERIMVKHCTLVPSGSSGRPVKGHGICDEQDDTASIDDTAGTVLDTESALGPGEIAGHIVATSATSLAVTLTGKDVPPGIRVVAELCRLRKGSHATQLALATLTPDSHGALTWKASVPVGKDGDALILQHHLCGPNCPNKWDALARYTLP